MSGIVGIRYIAAGMVMAMAATASAIAGYDPLAAGLALVAAAAALIGALAPATREGWPDHPMARVDGLISQHFTCPASAARSIGRSTT